MAGRDCQRAHRHRRPPHLPQCPDALQGALATGLLGALPRRRRPRAVGWQGHRTTVCLASGFRPGAGL